MSKKITLRVDNDLYWKLKISSLLNYKSMNQLLIETLRSESYGLDQEILNDFIKRIYRFRKKHSLD